MEHKVLILDTLHGGWTQINLTAGLCVHRGGGGQISGMLTPDCLKHYERYGLDVGKTATLEFNYCHVDEPGQNPTTLDSGSATKVALTVVTSTVISARHQAETSVS
jgi:hypothetical protein